MPKDLFTGQIEDGGQADAGPRDLFAEKGIQVQPNEQELLKQGLIAPAETPDQPTTSAPSTQPLGGSKVLDMLAGTGETAAALATGLVGSAAGLAGNVGARILGKSDQQAKDFQKFVSDYYTYKPQTQSGQGAMDIVGKVTEPLSKIRPAIEKGYGAVAPESVQNIISPNDVGNVAEAALFAGAPKAGKVAGKLKSGAESVAREGMDAFRSSEAIVDNLDTTIKSNMNKMIRPSVFGKQKASTAKAFDTHAANAVKNLVEDQPNITFERNGQVVTGELPETLAEWSDANANYLKRQAAQRTALSEQMGQQGVIINGGEVASSLNDIIQNPRLDDATRGAATRIQDLLARNEQMNPLQAQELLSTINQLSKGWYKNPEMLGAGAVAEKAGNALRDHIISKYEAAGPEFQQLGRNMRDSMAIEKDMQNRLRVDARKNKFGFFDLARYASVGDAILAASMHNPMVALPAAGIEFARWYMKRMNDPNFWVKTTFKRTAKDMGTLKAREAAQPFNPFNESNPYSAQYTENRPERQIGYQPVASQGMQDESFVRGANAEYPPRETRQIGYTPKPIEMPMADQSQVAGFTGEFGAPEPSPSWQAALEGRTQPPKRFNLRQVTPSEQAAAEVAAESGMPATGKDLNGVPFWTWADGSHHYSPPKVNP